MKLECLYAPHQYRENETWLNECADQGLYLEKWEATHATFSDEKKYGFQYWIDADNGGTTPNGRRQDYLESLGFEYVTSAPGGYFHVYRAQKGTPDIPENRKLRKQAGILYDFGYWFGLFFYTLIFTISIFSLTHALLNPERIKNQEILPVVAGLILTVIFLIYTLREFTDRIKLFLDLSKPAVHKRIQLRKPALRYGIKEKYSRLIFPICIVIWILLEML